MYKTSYTKIIFRAHGKAHKVAYSQMPIRDRYRDVRTIDWEAEKKMYKLGNVLKNVSVWLILYELKFSCFSKTFDKMRIFMSVKLKTGLLAILIKDLSQVIIWSRMMIMTKILHFHVKTVVLNLLKKNMSYHICAQLGTLENLKTCLL